MTPEGFIKTFNEEIQNLIENGKNDKIIIQSIQNVKGSYKEKAIAIRKIFEHEKKNHPNIETVIIWATTFLVIDTIARANGTEIKDENIKRIQDKLIHSSPKTNRTIKPIDPDKLKDGPFKVERQ